jgi:hypothetical protein
VLFQKKRKQMPAKQKHPSVKLCQQTYNPEGKLRQARGLGPSIQRTAEKVTKQVDVTSKGGIFQIFPPY